MPVTTAVGNSCPNTYASQPGRGARRASEGSWRSGAGYCGCKGIKKESAVKTKQAIKEEEARVKSVILPGRKQQRFRNLRTALKESHVLAAN